MLIANWLYWIIFFRSQRSANVPPKTENSSIGGANADPTNATMNVSFVRSQANCPRANICMLTPAINMIRLNQNRRYAEFPSDWNVRRATLRPRTLMRVETAWGLR